MKPLSRLSCTPIRGLRWTVELAPKAQKQLRALGHSERIRILKFLRERVEVHPDPVQLAKPLRGERYKGFCRFRVGDYRILARVERERAVVLAIEIGHRRDVYFG